MLSKKIILVICSIAVYYSVIAQDKAVHLTNTPVCTEKGDQISPKIVYDGTGGAIIVWIDNRKEEEGAIYAQKLNGEGKVEWQANGVPVCNSPHKQYDPQIISDKQGGAFLIWMEQLNVNNNRIVAQRINENGFLVWDSASVVISNAPGLKANVEVMDDNADGILIAWEDDRDKQWAIHAQKISSEGKELWTNDGVIVCDVKGKQSKPDITSDGNGGAFIVWEDVRRHLLLSTSQNIYAQHLNEAGQLTWDQKGLPVCVAPRVQSNPKIVSDYLGGAIITWQDNRNKSNDFDIYVQKIRGDGIVEWTENGLFICSEAGSQYHPEIISNTKNGAIVVWLDRRNADNQSDIYGQAIDYSGQPLWEENGKGICIAPGYQTAHQAVTDDNGGAIITWEDRTNMDEHKIFSQRVNSRGVIEWMIGGVLVSFPSKVRYAPVIANNGKSGAIISWLDERNGGGDIYAQFVNYKGKFYGVSSDELQRYFEIKPTRNTTAQSVEISVNYKMLQKGETYSFYLFNEYGKQVSFLEGISVKKAICTVHDLPKGTYVYNVKVGNVLIAVNKIEIN